MSMVGGGLAVLFAPPFLHDYWHPTYALPLWSFGGIEDFLYGFFTIGIASVVYEELLGKRVKRRKTRDNKFVWFVLPAIMIYILAFYLPIYLGLSSLLSALLSFLLLSVVIIYFRHDLFLDAIVSGLLLGLMTFIGFILFIKAYPDVVNRFWDMNGVNSSTLIGIPVGELLWAFGLGAAAGPAYEFFAGQKFKR